MTITENKQEYKIYFYNGFEKPKLLSSDLKGMVDIVVSDNYLGDKTEDFQKDIVEYYSKQEKLYDFEVEELQGELDYYNMFINPTIDDLLNEARRYFPTNDLPLEHFTDFKTIDELKEITSRVYDDFKIYEDYEGMFIIEDWIRDISFDSVLYASDSISDCEDFMDKNDLWEIASIYGVDSSGRAYYPNF